MASAAQVTATTTAGALIAGSSSVNAENAPTRRHLVKTASAVVYVGPPGVSASTGYLLTANQEYVVELAASESLHVITSSGTATVYVWGP